ncbi:flagellar basal body-associated FliL family protein [Rubellimicrobium aerolatum]|uniref:Flagellar protein FliL n=1 Tax=Rubellimicrobium aerolatum TaxID=490979 RepID=A0ABW0S9U6_9RHOB|nr:flagellar basal body-associated FliL family protein [Rubellimicrobium aerolatum]MBP1805083.1 flagellar FliL protein [Rubellimicrobium aerolatum]
MTEAAATDLPAEEKPKKSKLPLILGVVLAVLGGAGGFMAVKMGLLGSHAEEEPAPEALEEAQLPELAPAAFVALPPLVVNLPGGDGRRFLRFSGQLEVAPEHVEEVTTLSPRVVDVLNGYLRALEPREVEDPTALLRIRAQMLRRVQVVAGGDRVRDLLVMEFVIN